jgi:pyruvate decarboxylase
MGRELVSKPTHLPVRRRSSNPSLFTHSNELNAAYAADGYARVKEGSIGVLLTTFGVGELSATNGVAGAFSEHVPVLHIVGVPSTLQQKSKPMLHHTLGDGRFDAYHEAAKQFVISHTSLLDKTTAAAEIDRVLTDCAVLARPAYLMLPTDLVHEHIPRKRLLTPLNLQPPENDAEIESYVLDTIVKLIEQASSDAVVLLDACTIRHGVREETKAFVEQTKLPVFAAPMGKSAISEQYDRYGGVSSLLFIVTTCVHTHDNAYYRSTLEPSAVQKSRQR